MKTLLFSTTLAALALGALPSQAAVLDFGAHVADGFADQGHDPDAMDRRGRGRGHGGDDRGGDDHRGGRDDDDRDDDRVRGGGDGSGRDRPRIPGGSGCDDPGDVIEHPECRVGLPAN